MTAGSAATGFTAGFPSDFVGGTAAWVFGAGAGENVDPRLPRRV